MNKQFFFLSLILIPLFSKAQSPWTQNKGRWYTQLSYSTIGAYGTLFGDNNTERLITDNTFQFYGEYGLSERTTVLFQLPFKRIETGDLIAFQLGNPAKTIEAKERGLGNVSIGVKHNLIHSTWLLTGQLQLEANTGSFFEQSGIRTGFDAWTIRPLLSTGRGFKNAFVQGFVGADIRTNNYSSNIRLGGEIGYQLFQKLWIIAFVDVSDSLENGDIQLPETNRLTGLFVNDIEFAAYGLKGILELSKSFGITTGFATAFSGNNVPKKAAISFGLYHKF